MHHTLPANSAARKEIPLRRGCARYFPAALALVAITSKKGNDKHNPGQEMHHARGKSNDHADCIDRHLTDIDDLIARYDRSHLEGEPLDDWENQLRDELGQLAWRALALVQECCEQYLGAPLAPAARLPEPPASQDTGQWGAEAEIPWADDLSSRLQQCVDLSPKRQVPLHQRVAVSIPCECGDPNCTLDTPCLDTPCRALLDT